MFENRKKRGKQHGGQWQRHRGYLWISFASSFKLSSTEGCWSSAGTETDEKLFTCQTPTSMHVIASRRKKGRIISLSSSCCISIEVDPSCRRETTWTTAESFHTGMNADCTVSHWTQKSDEIKYKQPCFGICSLHTEDRKRFVSNKEPRHLASQLSIFFYLQVRFKAVQLTS